MTKEEVQAKIEEKCRKFEMRVLMQLEGSRSALNDSLERLADKLGCSTMDALRPLFDNHFARLIEYSFPLIESIDGEDKKQAGDHIERRW